MRGSDRSRAALGNDLWGMVGEGRGQAPLWTMVAFLGGEHRTAALRSGQVWVGV